MLVCVSCGANFPVQIVIEGRKRKLSLDGRKQCLDCRPHRPLRKPRKSGARQPKSLVCVACGKEFPAKMVIDGKMHSLYRRRFCLECSPFSDHNTSKVPPGLRSTEDAVKARRERRREQFRRSLRKRRRKRKADLVAGYGGRCVDCGYSTCPEALQFHHRDPSTKDFRLGNFSGSLARYTAEAAKCDLVCANCHRIRHAREILVSRHRMVELRRETKRRAIVSFGGVCLACRSVYAPAALEFHHPNASKKEFAISDDGIYRSWQKVQEELANCVMLCANCHAEVHAGVRVLNTALPSALERPTVAAS
jgi:hypothetical protein